MATTKKFAEEVNKKKEKFNKLIEIDKKLEKFKGIFSDSFPNLEFKEVSQAKKHSFKFQKMTTNEVCIVCNDLIQKNPTQCSVCGFWAHKSCSQMSSKLYFILFCFCFYFFIYFYFLLN